MAKVTLTQGTYHGLFHNNVYTFHNVEYAEPFVRFQTATLINKASGADIDATEYGFNCPQRPSRLEAVMGPFPKDTKFNEKHCNVLSVYSPGLNGQYPTLVWMHGGAFTSGGSQISLYNGSRLAKDGACVVVCINYRLGSQGFLQDDNRSLQGSDLPCGTSDVVTALLWVRSNIQAFGGDPSNVTVYGQSAGAYHAQTLFDIAPDLFHRAILQSCPAAEVVQPEDGRALKESIAKGVDSNMAVDIKDLLAAEARAVPAHSDMWLPFCPTSQSALPPAMGSGRKSVNKQVLIGWTADDGLCFARMRQPQASADQLDKTLTRIIFKQPSLALAQDLHDKGHTVATFELTWRPQGYELGATHCTDLPLVFGDEEAWKNSPMIGEAKWSEWEERGKRHRQDIGRFAASGIVPSSHDGTTVAPVSLYASMEEYSTR